MIPHNIGVEYESVLSLCLSEKYNQAAREIKELIRLVLKEIYKETKSAIKAPDRKRFQSQEAKVLKRKQIDKADLKDLARLFQESKVLDSSDGSETERLILKTVNLSQLVDLAETCSTQRADGLRKCVYTQLQFLATLLSFKGWIKEKKRSLIQRKFDLDLNTGIMTNPTDRSRNISFKAVTFGVMLGHIYSEVVESFQPKEDGSSGNTHEMQNRLNVILFKSGFNAGSNFGEALSRELTNEAPEITEEEKIETWCRFDTSVGWGKFESHVAVNQTTAKVSGKIVLKSNFLVAEKGDKDF